jgi:NAD(P)-dependent dehydrogenase (short-subunit alcohol dehydrogenase family)
MSRKDLADDSVLEFSRVFDFSGRVVLITGAASGIGKAIAELFSERGAQLALVDKSPQVRSVASALGNGARSWEADIVEEAQVARVVGDIAAALGRIDVLINNAGVGGVWPAESTSSADWSRVISINLTGQYFVAREVAKHMLKTERGASSCWPHKRRLSAWTGMPRMRRRKRACSECCGPWRSSGDRAG